MRYLPKCAVLFALCLSFIMGKAQAQQPTYQQPQAQYGSTQPDQNSSIQGQNTAEQQPQDLSQYPLFALAQEAGQLYSAVLAAQNQFPEAADPFDIQFNMEPAPWYSQQLYQLLVIQTQKFRQGEQYPATVVSFTNHPREFYEKAWHLAQLHQNQQRGGLIEQQARDVHYAYVRSLAVSYLMLEGLKRQFLNPDLPAKDLSKTRREELIKVMSAIHYQAQICMEKMDGLRNSWDYAFLRYSRYFPTGKSFEDGFGVYFHYKLKGNQGFSLASFNDFGRYLAPFVDANTRAKILIIILEDPETGMNPVSTSAQQQVPAPDSQRPSSTLLNDTQAGGQTTDSSTAQTDSNALPDIENNPDLQQLTYKLYYLLQSDAVKNDENVRKILQSNLDNLLRGRPLPKPLPPEDDEEESKKDDSAGEA